eukprot:9221972-Lingulodinium_polyedra.AAC.1
MARALLETARYDPVANALGTTLTKQSAPSSIARLAASNAPVPKTPSNNGRPRNPDIAATARELRTTPPC